MKTSIVVIVISVLLMLAGFILGKAQASEFTRIESAWNRGDVLGTQADFDRNSFRSMADMAYIAERGGKLKVLSTTELIPNLYAAKVNMGGLEQIWVLEVIDGKITWFGHRAPGGWMAERHQMYDVGTTAIGLAMGFTEANPAGVFALPTKFFALKHSRETEDYLECHGIRMGFDGVGLGASLANIATMAGAPFLGAVGVMAATVMYRHEGAIADAMFECAEYKLARV